jgi:hypothetical protein
MRSVVKQRKFTRDVVTLKQFRYGAGSVSRYHEKVLTRLLNNFLTAYSSGAETQGQPVMPPVKRESQKNEKRG